MSRVLKLRNPALGPGPLHSMAWQPWAKPCFSQLDGSHNAFFISYMRVNTIKLQCLDNYLLIWATANPTHKCHPLVDILFWSCDISTSLALSFLEIWSRTRLNQNLLMNRVDSNRYDSYAPETSPFCEMIPNTYRWVPSSCTHFFTIAGRHLT